MARARGPAPAWTAHFYLDSNGARPGLDFLTGVPRSARETLYAIIIAVRDRPPPAFPASTPMWSVMHKDKAHGGVDMSGICEARDKHDNRLYRVFCILDRAAPSFGLDSPALVILSGAEKPVREAMPRAVYETVRCQADRYFSTNPRPVARPPL